MTRHCALAPLAVALAIGSSSASAAFVEYSSTIAPQTAPFSTSFTVQKFDSSFGTLTGILLSLSSNIVARIDIWSNLSSPASFTNAFASFPITVTALSPDATSVSASPIATLASGTALPSMPGSFINTYPGLAASASGTTAVTPANWAFYVGLGGGSASFTANVANGSYGGTGPFGLFFSGSGTADGVFKIRYDFDTPAAVPLADNLALLAASLALFAWFAPRRLRPGWHAS